MMVKIGVYEYVFDNSLAQKFEELMLSDLQTSSLAFVENATRCSDMVLVCKKYTKEQVYDMIVSGIKAELSLFGVSVNV